MNEMKAKTEDEAKAELVEASKTRPGEYLTTFSAFGLFFKSAKRLHVFDPSDSVWGWYVLNGKVKAFSKAQRAADSMATPIMS